MFQLFFEAQYHNKQDLNPIFIDSVHDSSPLHVCSFILSILHQGIFSVSAFIVSVIYLSRFKESSHCSLHALTWRPLFLTSLLLADKVWEDKPVRNSSLAKLFPVLSNTEINKLEIEYLGEIGFNVNVKPDLFCSFCEKLLAERPQQDIVKCVADSDYAGTLVVEESVTSGKPKAPDVPADSDVSLSGGKNCGGVARSSQRSSKVELEKRGHGAMPCPQACEFGARSGVPAAAQRSVSVVSGGDGSIKATDGPPRSRSAGPGTDANAKHSTRAGPVRNGAVTCKIASSTQPSSLAHLQRQPNQSCDSSGQGQQHVLRQSWPSKPVSATGSPLTRAPSSGTFSRASSRPSSGNSGGTNLPSPSSCATTGTGLSTTVEPATAPSSSARNSQGNLAQSSYSSPSLLSEKRLSARAPQATATASYNGPQPQQAQTTSTQANPHRRQAQGDSLNAPSRASSHSRVPSRHASANATTPQVPSPHPQPTTKPRQPRQTAAGSESGRAASAPRHTGISVRPQRPSVSSTVRAVSQPSQAAIHVRQQGSQGHGSRTARSTSQSGVLSPTGPPCPTLQAVAQSGPTSGAQPTSVTRGSSASAAHASSVPKRSSCGAAGCAPQFGIRPGARGRSPSHVGPPPPTSARQPRAVTPGAVVKALGAVGGQSGLQ